MLNSTRYPTTRVKRGLCRHRERSSLHAGDSNAHHTKVFLRKMSLRPLKRYDLIQRGDLWWMRKGRGGQKKEWRLEEWLVLMLLNSSCVAVLFYLRMNNNVSCCQCLKWLIYANRAITRTQIQNRTCYWIIDLRNPRDYKRWLLHKIST